MLNYSKIFKRAFLIACIAVTNLASAQSNSCSGDVRRLQAKLNQASHTLDRNQIQLSAAQERVTQAEIHKDTVLETLRQKESDLRSVRDWATGVCLVSVIFDLSCITYTDESGIDHKICATTLAQCGLIAGRQTIALERVTSQRHSKETTENSKIAQRVKAEGRIEANIATLSPQVASLQSQFDDAAAKCDKTIANLACVNTNAKQCNVQKRSCNPNRLSCGKEGKTSCNDQRKVCTDDPKVCVSQLKECLTNVTNSCKSAYDACYNVDCLGNAKTACGG